MPTYPRIDFSDVQGNLVRGYNLRLARFLLFRLPDGETGRRFLAALRPLITTAADWDLRPGQATNVAVSSRGLARLEVPVGSLESFELAFRSGLAGRAALLGEVGESAPERWDPEWRDGIDLLVSVHAADAPRLDARRGAVLDAAEAAGLDALAAEQEAGRLIVDGEMSFFEHFGFRDGIGNPAIRGVPRGTGPVRGGGKLLPDGSWAPLATGEFLFGHLDEAAEIRGPDPRHLTRNGSYLVYRKIGQKVRTFREFCEAEAPAFAHGAEEVGARMVGRWRSGAPLARYPEPPGEVDFHGEIRPDAFRYLGDEDGRRCPISAHVRRVNPRGSLGFKGQLVDRHRLLRRGIPYGPWQPEDAPARDDRENGCEAGLIFISYQTSIERQYEFVIQQWMNDGNDFSAGDDEDALVGARQSSRRWVVQGDPERGRRLRIHPDLPSFTHTRGGEYFFFPGIGGLDLLIDGSVRSMV